MNQFLKYSFLIFTIFGIFSQLKWDKDELRSDLKPVSIEHTEAILSAEIPVHSDVWIKAIETNTENIKYSGEHDLNFKVLLFLGLALSVGMIVFTPKEWSNQFNAWNRLISQRSVARYILFHNLKLHF